MKLVKAGVLAAAILAGGNANADVVDLSSTSCAKFTKMPKDMTVTIVYWLAGYNHEDDAPMVVDTEKLDKLLQELLSYCTANPMHMLVAASEKVFDRGK